MRENYASESWQPRFGWPDPSFPGCNGESSKASFFLDIVGPIL